MNKSYRSIWNESLGAWVAASEMAKGRGKSSRAARVPVIAAAMLAGLFGGSAGATIFQEGSNPLSGTGISCAQPSGSTTWTCQVPNGNGGFATVSNVPNDPAASYQPDAAALIAWRDARLGPNAIAIGNLATFASGESSIAIGAGAQATGDGSTAIGVNAATVGSNAVSVGNNAGTNATDGASSVSVGYNAGQGTDGHWNTAIGSQNAGAQMVGSGNVSVGQAANYHTEGSFTTGLGAYAGQHGKGDYNTASGFYAGSYVEGNRNVSAGYLAGQKLKGDDNVAIGTLAGQIPVYAADGVTVNAASTDAVNGSQLYATNTVVQNLNTTLTTLNNGGGIKYFHANSTAADSSATGADSVAVGPAAGAAATNAVAIGNAASATRANSVALGAGSTTSVGAQAAYTGAYMAAGSSSSAGEVSVGSDSALRTVTHVADGVGATDAVNVRQLNAGVSQAIDQSKTYVDQQITNVNAGAAGMFQVSKDMPKTAPSPTGANSVAGGVAAVASGANSVAIGNAAQAVGTGSTALGQGAQATGGNSVALGAASMADRANTVSVGAAGAERQIVNVAPGTAGTDAVNVNQLDAGVASANQYTDAKVGQLQARVDKTAKDASAGTAGAMAMANLPQAFIPGKSLLAVGVAAYDGASAVALGVSKLSDNGQWIVKFSGTGNSRGKFGVAAGAGFSW